MGKHAKADIYSRFYDFWTKERGRGDIISFYLIIFLLVNLFTDWLSSQYHTIIHQGLVSIASGRSAKEVFVYQAQIAHDFANPELQKRFLAISRIFESNLSSDIKLHSSAVEMEDYFLKVKYISQSIILVFTAVDVFKSKDFYPRFFYWLRLVVVLGTFIFIYYIYISFINMSTHR